MAQHDEARPDLLRLLVDNQVSCEFPDSVLAEVQALRREPGIDDSELLDLRNRPFVTIDGAKTRDLDQAVYVEQTRDGFVVDYAIADAAYYVRPGRELFAEALRRGSSYYLPGFSVPMLPRALSEGLISLNPKEDRRAMIFRMFLSADARCLRTEVLRARVHSHAKLSFKTVQAFYDGNQDELSEQPFLASLVALQEFGKRRIELAEERGVVQYRRSETEIRMGEGKRYVIARALRRPVERYNEQLSLLCNVEGARFLRRGDREGDAIDPIYRIHPTPEAERLEKFKKLLGNFIEIHELPEMPWRWDSDRQTLADYLETLPSKGPEGRLALAIHRQALFLSGRSAFTSEPGEHFGVGAEVYGRFTAPMREIVGVFLHGETYEKLTGKSLAEPPVLHAPALRDEVILAANRSKDLQKKLTREANLLVISQVLSEAQSQARELPGTLMGFNPHKVHVVLDKPALNLKAYTRYLGGGPYKLAREGTLLESKQNGRRYRLGDRVSVRVVGCDRKKEPRWKLELSSLSS